MLQEIELELHVKYLGILNVYRFVKTDAFRHAFRLASNSEQLEAKRLINNQEQSKLNIWTEAILKQNRQYEYMSVRDLRDMVMALGIQGYTKMVRLEMISVLTKERQRVEK